MEAVGEILAGMWELLHHIKPFLQSRFLIVNYSINRRSNTKRWF